MFKALLHHLGRAVDNKGRELWAGDDCEAETQSEVDELAERLDAIERRLDSLDGKPKHSRRRRKPGVEVGCDDPKCSDCYEQQ